MNVFNIHLYIQGNYETYYFSVYMHKLNLLSDFFMHKNMLNANKVSNVANTFCENKMSKIMFIVHNVIQYNTYIHLKMQHTFLTCT